MQSWQSVVVCVLVTLVTQGTLGHPRAREQESGSVPLQVKEDIDQRQLQSGSWLPIENTGSSGRNHERMPESESKKTISVISQDEEGTKEKDVEKSGMPRKFPIPSAEEKKDEKLGSVGMGLGVSEVKDVLNEDDPTRSKKSTDMRELSYHSSPTTTVCIHVRSDRASPVVCGPQVGDVKDDKTVSNSARYANPQMVFQGYSRPMNSQEEQSPLPVLVPQKIYMRANNKDIEPSRPSAASGKQPQRMPYNMPSQNPYLTPNAARGSQPIRRTQPEDDNTLKTSDGPQSANPSPPYRIIPQGPPASVVVHRQYYQAPPLPSFSSNLIAPAPGPLKFNCALQPEGAQFLQPYASPIFRNAPSIIQPGYGPFSGEINIPEVSSGRMAQGPSDFQGYYYDPQGRAAQPLEVMGSPYEYSADPWVGTTFIGEDGQLYRIDDSQARSAIEDQNEQENLRATPSKSSSSSTLDMDKLRTDHNQQQEQLKLSSDKLQKLEKELQELQQKVARDEEEKKKHTSDASTKGTDLPAPESPSVMSNEPMKQDRNKNNKRHSNRFMKR